MDRIMALTPTDLPEPVVPAIRRWGILARSTMYGSPPMVSPSASGRVWLAFSYSADDSRSRR